MELLAKYGFLEDELDCCRCYNMDFDHHQPNSSSHDSQQQDHNTASSIGPDHLPDENDIEKLFPKCQPKQQQHKSTLPKSNGRYIRQQQNLSTRPLKQPQQPQAQYQSQQQKRQIRSHKTHTRRETEVRLNRLGTSEANDQVSEQQQQQQNQQRAKVQRQTNYLHELKQNRVAYFDSSDSLDELQTANEQQTASNNININHYLKRSTTTTAISGNVQRFNAANNYEHLEKSTSVQSFNNPKSDSNKEFENQYSNTNCIRNESIAILPHNRINSKAQRRNKRHTASKSLQQQIQKQQTSESQTVAQVPLINLSEPKPFETNEDARAQSQTVDPPGRCVSLKEKHEPIISSNATDNECTSARKLENVINRTSRGIVFIDRAETNISKNVEHPMVPAFSPVINKLENIQSVDCSAIEPVATSLDQLGDSVQQDQASFEQSRAESRLQLQQQQQPIETADLKLSDVKAVDNKLDSDERANIPEPIIDSIQSEEPFEANIDQLLDTNETLVVKQDLDLKDSQNNNDDDKYINLFVYDNSPQQSIEKKLSANKDDQIFSAKDNIRNVHGESNFEIATDVISLQHHASHQLLTAGQGEYDGDVVRNDTSTEELCNLNDSPLAKQKLTDLKTKKTSGIETQKDSETTCAIATKSILKHHRSMGTLQTVDEIAEINVEETGVAVKFNSSIENIVDNDVAMHAQGESSQIRKGFSPPGFPRRVKAPGDFSNSNRSLPNDIDAESSTLHIPTLEKAESIGVHDPKVSANQVHDVSPQTVATHRPSNCKPKLVDPSNLKADIINSERDIIEKNLDLTLDKISIANDETRQDTASITNLRHHKLPNELSHYSVVRSTDNIKDSGQYLMEKRPSTSMIQFTSLSDGESEPDVKTDHSSQRPIVTNRIIEDSIKYIPSLSVGSVSFPKLDEGLSDEIESCDDGAEDDEVDDDDEQAVEADVEDGDLDDDIDGPIKTSSDLGILPPIMEPFSRSQQSKQQRKLLNSIQSPSITNDLDGQPHKSSVTSYSNYLNQDNIDQNDLKSSQSNYVGQNGQPNYWLNNSSQQTTMSQPSSSSQYAMQKVAGNGGNNLGVTRAINMMNREDVKSNNRLSSDTDNETDRLLATQRNDQLQKMNNIDTNNGSLEHQQTNSFKQSTSSREVLIEGVLFNVKYLGSTHTECEGRGEKEDRINQAEMAVHEVKFRNGDASTPVEVQLFISTEKIMVLDDKHRKIMMDHSLRTISYIADIGDAIVLIVRKKGTSLDVTNDLNRSIPKTTCHVFESHDSHTITKSISQAFQVAYTELLKANGGDVSYLPKELDYQEVLNSQEMSMTELDMFARKDNEREVIVPKLKGEILGISIVESGWGSVLPTAVIASLKQDGPAYRCKKLSVGDQILSINGISLVGLSQAECQEILRKTHDQRVARLSVVPCPITVEVKIKRPDTKYQLGFSVQNGVICSLLRGGIAERGGVRVGHRIMSINGTTVVDVPHDKIVTLLASSVGEIRMKTCLTSLYRHMLGEEKAVFL